MTTVHELHEVQQAPTRVPRYLSPTSLDAALEAMDQFGERAKAVAGGTDLVVELDRGAHRDLEALVDLSRLTDLATIEVVDNAVRLGAMVTHNQVVASTDCRQLILPLAQACLEVGSPQLRNRATVAGNIVTASPANDTISALVALGATVEIASVNGQRSVSINDFFTGFRSTVLAANELVTAIVVPALGPAQRGVFVKAGLRRAQAISVVHLAAVVEFDGDVSSGATDNTADKPSEHTSGTTALVTNATIALGSVASTVVPVRGLDAALVGKPLDNTSIAAAVALAAETATPIDDLRATAEYRNAVVSTMVERALQTIASGQQADQWPDNVPLLSPAAATTGGVPGSSSGPRSGSANSGLDTGGLDIGPEDAITTTVNGRVVSASAASGHTLLDWLREEAELNGVKEGCAEGECGACTVILDGQAVMSCLVPAARADGADLVTVEGLANAGQLAPIQHAFVETGGVQCGFCTPGFLVSCSALLDEHPQPTLEQIRLGLAGNLCRCTGYKTIETAVQIAARVGKSGSTTTEVSS